MPQNASHHNESQPVSRRQALTKHKYGEIKLLTDALYNTNIVGQTQPITRPDYKGAIRTGDKNSVVVLDVYNGKKQVEIVGWRRVDEKGLAKMERQAKREGGQFLILSPVDGSAAALSTLPSGLSSEGKVNDNLGNGQENVQEISYYKTSFN